MFNQNYKAASEQIKKSVQDMQKYQRLKGCQTPYCDQKGNILPGFNSHRKTENCPNRLLFAKDRFDRAHSVRHVVIKFAKNTL